MSSKLLAEFIGTATLSFAVLLSTTKDTALITPVIASLVLGLFVYSIGRISGCHINPAVTIGLWSVTKIDTVTTIQYIVAQCLGALTAYGLVYAIVGGVTLGFVPTDPSVFWAEMIGAAIFTFGIASVVYSRSMDAISGVVIGGSLLLGIIMASALGSNGILNPAVGIALGSTSTSYILGSIVGAIVGMHVYRTLKR